LPCAASAALCAVLVYWFLELWRADLRIPFTYDGDAFYFLSLVKGLTQGDWIWGNSRLGMPLGADWHDFPVCMTLDMAAMRFLALFTHEPGLIANIFWLCTLMLTAATATFAFLRFHVKSWVAMSLGVVYALQPFAFFRGLPHLCLVFYPVPLLAAGVIELAQGRFTKDPAPGGKIRSLISSVPVYLWVACVAQGLSYVYNAFFAIFLFGVSTVIAYVTRRRARDVLTGVLLIATIAGVSLVNIGPSFEYQWRHGKNPAAGKGVAEAEMYAMKIRYLLTPIPDYRLKVVRYLESRLSGAYPPERENSRSRLGTTASLGFLFLLAYGLCRCAGMRSISDQFLGICAALSIAIVLLATNGGFGSLFNAAVLPDIRCYNRIIVFLSFLSLAPVAVLLTRLHGWWIARGAPVALFRGLLLAAAILAVADEASTTAYLRYADRKEVFDRDEQFVGRVESTMAADSLIFQLPYTNFPPDSPPGNMATYDHSRAYLHSHKYKWSWAAVGGRPGGEWVKAAAAMPAKDMLERLSLAGFSGIWLDRFGYTTEPSPADALTSAVGSPALTTPDGRVLFYDIRAYAATIRHAASPESLSRREARALHPVSLEYGGFFGEEHNAIRRWRWCGPEGTLTIRNTLQEPRRILLSATLQGVRPEPDPLLLQTPEATETLWPTSANIDLRRTFALPANGSITVRFRSKGGPLRVPGDPRVLHFVLINCQVRDI